MQQSKLMFTQGYRERPSCSMEINFMLPKLFQIFITQILLIFYITQTSLKTGEHEKNRKKHRKSGNNLKLLKER